MAQDMKATERDGEPVPARGRFGRIWRFLVDRPLV